MQLQTSLFIISSYFVNKNVFALGSIGNRKLGSLLNVLNYMFAA